jgi:uncharacterized membrane protein YjjP (DUF1212 family)
MEMALDAGLVVLRNGGSTIAAERCFSNVLKGFAEEGVAAVWRLDFVAATETVTGHSSTVVRSVGPIGTNLNRVSAAARLGERMARREMDTATFINELERIARLPSPYGRWVVVLAAAGSAACFSRTAGGDWGSFGIAFVAAAAGQSLRSLLQARKVAATPVTLVCGVLSATIAALALRMGLSQVDPATLLASVIYMIPGLLLINGFVDMISRKYLLVAVERLLSAASLFLVLAIAIALARTLVP